MLEVRDLRAFYGDVQVLWGVDLAARQGRVTAVIGPNGAGKTTLLRAIMGLARARGQVLVGGRETLGLPPERMARQGVALVPEGGRVFGEMTVVDNLRLGAHLLRDRAAEHRGLDHVLELFPRLAERRSQKASTLSGGERQMLALGRALMGRPRLLLLDEPSLGLHPLMVNAVFEALAQVAAQDMTILLVEQKVSFALEASAQAYVLENGRVALAGPGPELLRNEHVRRAYLAV